jgi:ATP-dependent Lon protease
LPKQLTANGLEASNIVLTEPTLLQIVTGYTREAGVRSLERAIGSVVRHKAVEWAERDGEDEDKLPAYEKEVREQDLEKILGIPRYDNEKERTVKRGVVYGLVVSGLGEGGVLPVETCTLPGRGDLRLTGSLGDVSSAPGSPPSLGTRLKPRINRTGYQGEQFLGPELGKGARLRFTDRLES